MRPTLDRWLLPLALLAAGTAFIIDMYIPLDYSTSLMYVAIVAIYSSYTGWPRSSIFLAALCTVFTVFNYFYGAPPSNQETHQRLMLINQGISIAAMWCLTLLLLFTRRTLLRLAEHERFLRAVLDADPECITFVDREGRLLQVNPAGLEMLEAGSPQALIGQHLLALVAQEYRAAFQSLIAGVFQGHPGMLQFESVGLRGTRRWLETHAVPLRDEAGQVTTMLGITRDVTDQHRANSALRENEQRLRLALEAGGMGSWDWDLQEGSLELSKEMKRILGSPDDEAWTQDLYSERLHPDDRERITQAVQKAVLTGNDYAETCRFRRADGEYRWLHSQGRTLQVAGRPARMYGVTYDVTEARQAQEQLRQSEERFRQMAENIQEIFWMSNHDISFVYYVSPAFEKIWGRGVDSINDSPYGWWEGIHPEDLQRVKDAVSSSLKTGLYEVEYRVASPAGTMRWVRARGYYVAAATQAESRMVGIVEDITERKAAEEAARAAETRFRAMVEKSSDAIGLISPQGEFTFLSESAERVFGWPLEELVGIPLTEFTHLEDRERNATLFEQVLTSPGGSRTADMRWLNRDGSWRWLEATATNMLQEPAVQSIVTNIRDISARRRAEEESRRHMAELAHVHRLTTAGQMVAELAHEINQPLYSINNYAGACAAVLQGQQHKNGFDDHGQLHGWIDQIALQAQRAGEIIRRLRHFVQYDGPLRRQTPLNDIARDVLRLLEMDPRFQAIEVETRWSEGLPSVSVDRVQIEQVLVNLLINAAEAMTESPSAQRRIQLETRRREEIVELSVRDAGPGVSDEQMERLFEPYYTTKPDGMGLGLAISRSILKDHGGELWAERNSVGGMTFRMVFPWSPSQQQE